MMFQLQDIVIFRINFKIDIQPTVLLGSWKPGDTLTRILGYWVVET